MNSISIKNCFDLINNHISVQRQTAAKYGHDKNKKKALLLLKDNMLPNKDMALPLQEYMPQNRDIMLPLYDNMLPNKDKIKNII